MLVVKRMTPMIRASDVFGRFKIYKLFVGRGKIESFVAAVDWRRFIQGKWTKGSILTKIIGTYKSEMPGNSAGNYVTLHEFHSLLIFNGVK